MRRGLWFLLFILWAAAAPAPAAAASLVPAAEAVSDEEARLALARLLSWNEASLAEAAAQYRLLLAENPGRSEARLELAKVLIRQKRLEEAFAELEVVILREPQNREALLEAGRILLWRKRYDEALALFDRLRREGPVLPEAELEAARALSWSGRFAEAIPAYEKALAGREVPAELAAEFADALLYGGRPKEALEYYQRALRAGLTTPSLRRRLAEALGRSGRRQEALALWEELGRELPEDRQIRRSLAMIHLERGDYARARPILAELLAREGQDRELIEALADVEAALGHAKRCRELSLKALALAPREEGAALRYAGRMTLWGDFSGAEKIYRGLMQEGRDDPALILRLAEVLAGAERYEEAEGLYGRLLWQGRLPQEALLGLAGVKMKEKKFAAALAFADELLLQDPKDRRARRLKGEALLAAGRPAEALALYEALGKEEPREAAWPLEMGKILLRLGQKEKAAGLFAAARELEPALLEARFHLLGTQGAAGLEELLEAAGPEPRRLVLLAELYGGRGEYAASLECYRKALETDGEYFPAQIGLAQDLAFARRYDESIGLYRRLREEFPGASKIMIGLARVLGWSGKYDQSLALYEEARLLNPRDPVVVREKARVALWAKRVSPAMAEYDRLLFPSWQEAVAALPDAGAQKKGELLAALEALPEEGLPLRESPGRLAGLSPQADGLQGSALFEVLALRLIQRNVRLEKEAKEHLWERRFRKGLEAYEKLLQASPGNEEALFDLAQIQCSLGLCDEERATYERLLALDPLHFLAREALNQNEARQRPALAASASYWHEDGRGDLSQIARRQEDLIVEAPLAGRHHLRLAGHDWRERPTFTGRTQEARGFTLAWEGVVDAYLRGEAAWRHKSYRQAGLPTLETGYGRLWWNIDRLELGGGLERSEEITNHFAMEQGITAAAWWLSAAAKPLRELEVKGVLRRLAYSDENRGYHHSLSFGYDLTDHPRQLRMILSADYRDTKEEFSADGQGGMVHPYWTPRDYWAGTLTADWRHDLSAIYLCGARRHYYELRFSLGTDSEGNGAFRLEGEWRLELAENWGFSLTGLVHRSREWDAEGLWAKIEYRF